MKDPWCALGRLDDVHEQELQAEASYDVGNNDQVIDTLRRHGATPEEIRFLRTQRVELNAFASDALVAWLEGKLAEHGVKKVIPGEDVLEIAWRRARAVRRFRKQVEAIAQEVEAEATTAEVPADLRARIEVLLDQKPEISWKAAVRSLE